MYSTKALTPSQQELLEKIYYKDKFTFGRDRLFEFLKQNYPDSQISNRQLRNWLQSQYTHQVNLIPRRTKDVRSTLPSNIDSQISVDLIDMSAYAVKNYKWIITAINNFSKKASAYPLKTKSEKDVLEGMKKISDEFPDIHSIRTDNGVEFNNKSVNKLLEDKNIKHILILAYKPQSNGIVERFNGTLKRMIFKLRAHNPDFDWASQLPILISNYNSSVNDTTKLTPDAVGANNQTEVYNNIKDSLPSDFNKRREFSIGDLVRVKEQDPKLTQRYWSNEIYKVSGVFKPRKKTFQSTYYKVYDPATEKEIPSIFYSEDLQRIFDVQNEPKKEQVKYIIQRVENPVVRGNKVYYTVWWHGYNDPTSEARDALLRDIPKIIQTYERKHKITYVHTANNIRIVKGE